MEAIIRTVQTFDGATVFQPAPGSAYPEISWGDAYFYYAPDGVMPEHTQPYGTIITKDYPDDTGSKLNEPGRFRVNVNAGRDAVAELPDDLDPASVDTFIPHPLYAAGGWISVINPTTTADRLIERLRAAHDAAHARAARRSAN
ncbi:DUF6194 family protein [Plantibacter cousiniae (nom. nud.)]|nr:DUF6194 family protein [Plantibacter cousiniae]